MTGFDRFMRFGILAPGGKIPELSPHATLYIKEVPVLPQQLPEMFKVNRRTEDKTFSALESGCKVYISVAYMNGKGQLGPWSKIIEVIIT